MSKDERSLLLYFETCVVDYQGAVDKRRMNEEDFDIAKKWNKAKFIEFGRICFESIEKRSHSSTGRNQINWVHLSDNAFDIVHIMRRKRAERGWKNRKYVTTTELRRMKG